MRTPGGVVTQEYMIQPSALPNSMGKGSTFISPRCFVFRQFSTAGSGPNPKIELVNTPTAPIAGAISVINTVKFIGRAMLLQMIVLNPTKVRDYWLTV
mmetsp:Transcript_44238/g.90281  ORF Transcript_44238/g.90281 Transcript_44238/m.90281 type:complete len:98 (+) Transcript_44238:565-858(+)